MPGYAGGMDPDPPEHPREDEVDAALDDARADLAGRASDEPDPAADLASPGPDDLQRPLRGQVMEADLGDADVEDVLAALHDPPTSTEADQVGRDPGPQSGVDDDADVSEFLRELSRLALGEDAPAPSRPERATPDADETPPPAPAAEPRHEAPRPKKRRLFGFGS